MFFFDTNVLVICSINDVFVLFPGVYFWNFIFNQV